MIKLIIVEDDSKHIERLQKCLSQVETPVEILAICSDVDTAFNAINEFNPELVFLDVELEEGKTSFDLLKKLNKIKFDIIFTTSHIDLYIQEIRASGLTYIPKPVILDELEEALSKYQKKRNDQIGIKQVNSLVGNLQNNNIDTKTIWIPTGFDYTQIQIQNIIFCESDNQYTIFHVDIGQKVYKKLVASKGIGEWEKDLEQFRICRIHKQYLVNLKHVKKYTRGEGGTVTLINDDDLPVSKTGKERFMKMSGLK